MRSPSKKVFTWIFRQRAIAALSCAIERAFVVLSNGGSFERSKPNFGGKRKAHTVLGCQNFVEVLARLHRRFEVGYFVGLRI
jgi:hypothetical protein